MLCKKNLLIAVSFCLSIAGFTQTKHTWTGFYIGPNAGILFDQFSLGQNYSNSYGDGSVDQISGVFVPGRGIVIVPGTSLPVTMSTVSKTNFTGGIQLGYLKQSDQWVYGLEGDLNFLSVKVFQDRDDSLPPTALQWITPYGYHHTAKINLTESIRARFGIVKNNSFIYLTAGVAFASAKATAKNYYNANTYWPQPWSDGQPHPTPAQDRFIVSTSNQTTSVFAKGLVVGIGYEWMLNETCTLGIEYRYSALKGTFNVNGTNADTSRIDARPTYSGYFFAGPQNIKLISNQVTFRLNISLDAILNLKKSNSLKK